MINLFGPGVAWGQRTDVASQSINWGKVKKLSIDASASVKGETGGMQVAQVFGRGEVKITGKLTMGAVSTLALAYLFWGVTPATGEALTQFLEAGAVPATSPYTYTVSNPTGFGLLEVVNGVTGLPFQIVSAGSEAQGKCSVNPSTGKLTFAAADQGVAILVSYNYTVAGGNNIAVTNQLQGFTPAFSISFFQRDPRTGNQVTVTVPYVTASKYNFDAAEDKMVNPEIDVMIGANPAGQVITYNVPELS